MLGRYKCLWKCEELKLILFYLHISYVNRPSFMTCPACLAPPDLPRHLFMDLVLNCICTVTCWYAPVAKSSSHISLIPVCLVLSIHPYHILSHQAKVQLGLDRRWEIV